MGYLKRQNEEGGEKVYIVVLFYICDRISFS